MSRPAIGQHPARIVLLDLSPPFDILVGRSICDALENVLCVASSLAGLSKIPLLGIYVLTTFPEMILPLVHVSRNTVRLYTALQDIKALLEETLAGHSQKEIEQCLGQGLVEACRQFQRYTGSTQPASLTYYQLEIIVITAHRSDYVQKCLKDLPSQIDMGLLKRILSVTVHSKLSDSDMLSSEDAMAVDSSDEEFGGLVDNLYVEPDAASLQKFFYGWFTDCLSEKEYLHILLPPPSPADTELVIKCDTMDKMLNPQQLPCHNRFILSADASTCKYVYQTPSKAVGMTIPIHKLKTLYSLPRSTLCESLLFGFPLVTVPTSCWTLDWEELEKNQQNFIALCEELMKKDHVLLLQLIENDEAATTVTLKTFGTTSSKSVNASPPTANGYFILMPSEHRTLLLKSIMCADILLPFSHSQYIKPPSKESELCIQASLTQVDTCDQYNPLKFSAGLVPTLKHTNLPKYVHDKSWVAKRKTELKRFNEASSIRPMVPSPPKISKPGQGNRLTATMWTNPLSNVVKKSNKQPPLQNESNSRQTTLDSNNVTKMSWKSGFVND